MIVQNNGHIKKKMLNLERQLVSSMRASTTLPLCSRNLRSALKRGISISCTWIVKNQMIQTDGIDTDRHNIS